MLECSFGFRPRRSAHDALQVLIDEAWRGRRWVAESDIANCFEAIPHSGLMSAIEERIVDRHVLKLLRAMLRAGVMQDGAVTRSVTGTPQGGVISPVPVQRLPAPARPAVGRARHTGCCVRYADDLLAMCRDRAGSRERPAALTAILAELGLELKQAKTRIVHLTRRRRGTGLPRLPSPLGARQHPAVTASHASSPAGPHGRPCSTPATGSGRSPTGAAAGTRRRVVQDVNRFLRGWAGYFRYGNSAQSFDKINHYATDRLARLRRQAPQTRPAATAGRSSPTSRRTGSG